MKRHFLHTVFVTLLLAALIGFAAPSHRDGRFDLTRLGSPPANPHGRYVLGL